MANKSSELPCILEKGRDKNGEPTSLNRRLFMQLQVFREVKDSHILISSLKRSKMEGVLYESINHPTEVGLLTFSESENFFVNELRNFLRSRPFSDYELQSDYTMIGRTYSLGYESDLEDWLLKKPRRTVLNTQWPWAIWYPLRRSGSFSKLPVQEQKEILREHGTIGFSFGKADYAHDVRLACHGLDRNDNDFVIGLLGRELFPLSALVETMRKTKQTSTYLERLGPFFIGKAVWQSRI